MPTQSYDEMMKNWMDAQKKMWDNFFEAMPGAGKSPTTQTWEQMIALGEETFKKTAQAQTDWIQTWVKSVSDTQGVPAQVVESAKQFQEMFQRWSETQEKLWGNWFTMLKGFDPSKGMALGNWQTMTGNPFQLWQDTTRKMIDAQFEWMRTWMGQTRK